STMTAPCAISPAGPSPSVGSPVTTSLAPVSRTLIGRSLSRVDLADRRREQWPDGADPVLTTGDDVLTADDDVTDVLGAGNEEDLVRVCPGGVRAVQPDRQEVSEGALPQHPAVVPAEGQVAVLTAHLVKRLKREPAPLKGVEAFVHLHGLDLLEGIDDGVLVGPDAEQGTRVVQGTGRPDAVGEVTLRARAQTDHALPGAEEA